MKQSNHSTAITLANVSKKYEIHHEKPTLVEKFVKGKNETFWALRDIDITIQQGERVGIIGRNGSGKTTLLKIITGITTPTQGSVETNGKVVSLIDLEAGFHEDLTGIQNIYLNGMMLGMSNREIDKNLAPIMAFADIKQFIDVPLYTYSSGMKLRLGFSIALHARPQIIVLDESVSVGDFHFQKKISMAIKDMMRHNVTLVVASHDLTFLKTHCQRILLLEKGRCIQDGGLTSIRQYLARTGRTKRSHV
jgi:ABC-type polysaccharide/polyol phosphate transport system ATPase subunit